MSVSECSTNGNKSFRQKEKTRVLSNPFVGTITGLRELSGVMFLGLIRPCFSREDTKKVYLLVVYLGDHPDRRGTDFTSFSFH